MNTENTRTSLRFWAPTGVTGAVASAAVALLLSTAASAPAYSTPSNQQPIEPGFSFGDVAAASGIGYCFMGRPGWPISTDPLPRCHR